MKLHRGNYDGASEFAYFDKPVNKMSLEECRGLLETILHQASPGMTHHAAMYEALGWAEEAHKVNTGEKITPREGL